MNNTNSICKSILATLTINLLLPCLLFAAEPQQPVAEPTQEQIQQEQLILDQLFSPVIAQTKDIGLILEQLSLMVSNHAIATPNKQEILVNIKESIKFVTSITNETFLHVHPYHIYMISAFNKAMMQHINKALDKHMTTFAPFPVETVMQRQPPTDLTLETLAADIAKNGELLEMVRTRSGIAGLRWYNLAYRAFDYYIMDPAWKYSIPQRLGLTLGLAAIGLHTALTLEKSYKDVPILGAARQYFGWHPEYAGGGNQISNNQKVGDPDAHHVGSWGHFNKFWIDRARGYDPVGTAALGGLAALIIKERDKISNVFSKIFRKIHNKLRGGQYAEKQLVEDKFLIKPRVTFKDLVGLEYEKEILGNIVTYMENPERFDRAKLTPEKGYLLTGPTRTGKSFLAEALAGEIKEMFKRTNKNPDNFNVFVLSASFIHQEGIDNIIERAKKLSPCILFIDEIDLLMLQRGVGAGSELLGKFLSSMSGVLENDPDKVVIMMAATNRPEHLDHALRQRGRYGKELRFQYPSFKHRKEHLNNKIGVLANLDDFDIDKLARETEGKSFEDLNSMVRAAFLKGIIKGEMLKQATLEACLDEEILHIIPYDANPPSTSEKELVATHQAGQALSVLLLNGKDRLAKVTIKPYLTQLQDEAAWAQYDPNNKDNKQKKIQYGKIHTWHYEDLKDMHRYEDKVAQCKIQLAGFAAEQLMLGSCGYSYHQEASATALEIAKSIVTKGININSMPEQLKNEYFIKAMKLKDECEEAIAKLLAQHKDKIKKIADALLKQETLTGEQVAAIAGLPYSEPKPEKKKVNNGAMFDVPDKVITPEAA